MAQERRARREMGRREEERKKLLVEFASLSFMTISLHSHSGQFCSHAVGTLEEIVQEAIRKGFTTFGLSEHVPRYRIQDLYPEEVTSSPLLDRIACSRVRHVGTARRPSASGQIRRVHRRSKSTQIFIRAPDQATCRNRDGVHQ